MVHSWTTQQAKMSKRERAGQFVASEHKFIQVDELAEFHGNRTCQCELACFSASRSLVYQQGNISKRRRTGQLVAVQPKTIQLEELAKFGWY
jgi:hypothetical protein